MNSLTLKLVMTFALSTAVMYILFSINFADFNILQWTQPVRGAFLLLLLLAYLIGFICVGASEEEKEKRLKKERRFG